MGGSVLGSILRIDPTGSNAANGEYGIPDDNPFVRQEDFVDEIFTYGFRNPFRFSFDMEQGDLYVGDVGQDDLEEVDVVVAGGNYGWNFKEGSFCFDPNEDAPGLAFDQDAHGELYVMANDTGVPFGTGDGFDIPTGVGLRIVPAAPDSAQTTSESARNFRTHLSGREQVPPIDTRAQGQAIFQLSKDGTELAFKLIVANIDNVIGAHIHLAPTGQNGPIVLPLLGNPFIPDPGVTVNGILVEGTAKAADVSGPLVGDLDAPHRRHEGR